MINYLDIVLATVTLTRLATTYQLAQTISVLIEALQGCNRFSCTYISGGLHG